jgi:hypothetical protein
MGLRGYMVDWLTGLNKLIEQKKSDIYLPIFTTSIFCHLTSDFCPLTMLRVMGYLISFLNFNARLKYCFNFS